MPELPEVETVVRDLRPLVVGRTIRAVRNGALKLRKTWDAGWNAALAGRRVEAVRRRGKWIVIELVSRESESAGVSTSPPTPPLRGEGSKGAGDSGSGADVRPLAPPSLRGKGAGGLGCAPRLVVHLGMTGQFTAVPAADPRPDHLHLVFELDDGMELRFRDQRRFGSATYFPDPAAVEAFFTEANLGPEPFGLDPEAFRRAVRGTRRSLKAILLDQQIVAGVGNIYADEACFRAGLHPARPGRRLSAADADRLRESVEAVLTAAIEHRGSTIRDYVGGSGLRGGFQDAHAVYGRTGMPCRTCETPVRVARVAGRSSHFCPRCQGAGTRGQRSGVRGQKAAARKP